MKAIFTKEHAKERKKLQLWLRNELHYYTFARTHTNSQTFVEVKSSVRARQKLSCEKCLTRWKVLPPKSVVFPLSQTTPQPWWWWWSGREFLKSLSFKRYFFVCAFEKYTKSAIRLGGSSFVERTSSSDGIHRVQLERDWKWKLLLFFLVNMNLFWCCNRKLGMESIRESFTRRCSAISDVFLFQFLVKQAIIILRGSSWTCGKNIRYFNADWFNCWKFLCLSWRHFNRHIPH